MSNAYAVAHGAFGRACLYVMDRAMAPHAHREGHLIFHVEGAAAEVVVDGRVSALSPGRAVAVSPWRPHWFRPRQNGDRMLALVLYVRPAWFVEASRQAAGILRFGRTEVDVGGHMALLVAETARLLASFGGTDGTLEDCLSALTQEAFDQTWQWTGEGGGVPTRPARDFRIRSALKLLDENLGEAIDLASVSKAAGLSRPHFFKLFREQVGLPPTLYMNALRMERAIERLARGSETVADIGFDLGFSTPASFSRFFIANGVVPPSVYRRSVRAVGH
jgi:AraC-like DNA-binding protein/mannose-6-phosphate isomerase-like protein (cupin superfamily)